jgi:hypothetical protein
MRAICGADPTDLHLAPLIGTLWNLQPESFLGLWQDRMQVAFIACHRLDDRVKAVLLEHPVTRPAASRVPTDETAYVMCLYGVEPDMEVLVNGSMARAIPMLLRDKARYVNLLPPMDWESYLTLLGYERFPEADSASASGTPIRAYLMDLTRENLVDKVERALPRVTGQREAQNPPDSGLTPGRADPSDGLPDAPFEETVNRVNRFLKRYHKLTQYPEYARGFLPLLPPAMHGLNDYAAVQTLMARSLAIVDRLSGGNPEERRISRILRYAYIQKIGTHEATAEFLGIPVPSYFRYLKSAIRRFAFEWIHNE